jgi:hypothetical protein
MNLRRATSRSAWACADAPERGARVAYWRSEDGTRLTFGDLVEGLSGACAEEAVAGYAEPICELSRAAARARLHGDAQEARRLAIAARRLCQEIAGVLAAPRRDPDPVAASNQTADGPPKLAKEQRAPRLPGGEAPRSRARGRSNRLRSCRARRLGDVVSLFLLQAMRSAHTPSTASFSARNPTGPGIPAPPRRSSGSGPGSTSSSRTRRASCCARSPRSAPTAARR